MVTLVPVILSGGAGSRLWPVSREGHPKPFMKLADGQTLIEKTYQRANALGLNKGGQLDIGPMVTVTNRDYYFMSRDELEKSASKSDFLLEPFGRNTAAAIALAAHKVAAFDEQALLLVLPADHLIHDETAFARAVSQAMLLAKKDYLVTFGIVPSGPETGFGYIECGKVLESGFEVARFVEKPTLYEAQAYLSQGNYLWNSGMFCFGAKMFLQELGLHAPEIAIPAQQCWDKMTEQSHEAGVYEIPASQFENIPSNSIDYAVMEHSQKVAVIPAQIGWSDIGSWDAIAQLVTPDERDNRAIGEAVFIDTNNTFVQSEDRLVATVGVRNLVIIDTPDALLVVDAHQTQAVKSAVQELQARGHQSAKLHRTVLRPWGSYAVIEEGLGFKVKRIEVKPGGSLSLQMHHHRSEHWIVVSGQAQVVNGDQILVINANESTYIPAGHRHRLSNATDGPLVMIEVQSGHYLGEDDIVRFDDRYGRA